MAARRAQAESIAAHSCKPQLPWDSPFRQQRGCGRRGVAAQTPKAGGHFRVALDDGNTTDSLDPATFQSRYMITMAQTYANYLTEIKSDNKVTGELAESWDVSPDAKTWTLKLRKGVEFHNGKTFRRQ